MLLGMCGSKTMEDIEPTDLMDFSRCTNRRLFEYAREYENDAYALTAIRAALATRREDGADVARVWIDRRIRALGQMNRPKRWFQNRLLQVSVVAMGAVGVGIGQGAAQHIWELGRRLVGW